MVLRSVTMIALSALKEGTPINVFDPASAAHPKNGAKGRARG
jgi:hypothetical protein